MNYLFDKMYIGTLAENEVDDARRSVIYQGDILCTRVKDNVYVDLLSGQFYDYLGLENNSFRQALNGQTYLYGLSECFPERLMDLIVTRRGLVKLAMELNENGKYVNIPHEDLVKVKRK